MSPPPDSTDNGSGAARRAARVVRHVVERAMQPTTAELRDLVAATASSMEALRADHEAVAEDLRGLHHWLDWRFGELEADTRVDELGRAVEGGVVRMAELAERIDSLARGLRRVADRADAGPGPAAPGAAARPSLDEVFDYDAFEKQFRGDPGVVFAEQVRRYADVVDGLAPVVDLGCGRGGFIAELAGRGVPVVGVEPNAELAALARAQGIEVHEQYAADYLRTVPDESLGAVVSFQLVEHLTVHDLIELVDLAVQKLRPGGVFVAETPNPASWIVLHTSFILDPTHVQPLHPGLLAFVCDQAGLDEIRVEYFAPAESMYVPVPPAEEVPEWARGLVEGVGRLNHLLFGPQDYAVIARRPMPVS